MFCAISGKPPIHPVLSPSSKCIFERDLILQQIQQTGRDPISNSPLKPTDLIEINTASTGTLTNALNSSTLASNYSIPNLLSSLQHEYDAIMLENFQLRKEIDKVVQELSRALYERDAAKLVAAGLLRDKMNVRADLDSIVSYYLRANGDDSSVQSLLERSQEYVHKVKEMRERERDGKGTSINFKTCINVPSTPVSWTNCRVKGEFITKWPPLCGSTVTTLISKGQVQKNIVLLAERNEVLTFSATSEEPVLRKLPFDTKDVNLITISPDSENFLLLQDTAHSLSVFNIKSGAYTVLPLDNPDDSHTILLTQHEYVMRNSILHVTNNGNISYLSPDKPRVDIPVAFPKDRRDFHSATLHKDGILLALVSASSVTLVNLARPHDEPTVFSLGEEIPSEETPIHQSNERVSEVRFSSNGYWMSVCVGCRIVVFDLRKDEASVVSVCFVEELAKSNSEMSVDMIWDMDPECTFFVGYNRGYHEVDVNGGGSGSTSPLVFYKYNKKAKNWENYVSVPVLLHEKDPKRSDDIQIPRLSEDIVGIQLLESTSKTDETLSVLMQCPTKSYVLEYSFKMS